MPLTVYITVAVFAAGLIFNAGGLVWAFIRLKKDVDGVGRKLNSMQREKEDDRRRIITAFLVYSSTGENREKLANLLND